MRRRTWLAASLVVGLAGCLAPTLPVPPPSAPEVSAPDADGMVTVKGGNGSVQANAEVTVWNFNLDGGTGVTRSATPQGAYQIQIRGKSGDKLQVWQTVGFERGTPTPDITVP